MAIKDPILAALSQEDPKPAAKGNKQVADPILKVLTEDSSSGDPLMSGQGSLGYDPTKYGFNLKVGQDNDLLRAQNQGFGEQLGKTLANIVPNVVTGILENVGYLGALATEWGDDRDYSNALVKTMQSAKNPFGDIYREHPNDTWSMRDSAWWLQNFSSLAESAAEFAVIGAGTGALFGKAAELVAEGAGKVLGTGVGSTGVLATKAAAQGLTAATLAYTEGAQIGYQVYQKSYDTQLKRLRASGLDAKEADEQAKHIASQAAASTVQINTAINTVLNLPQLAVLFKDNNDLYQMFRKGNLAQGAEESLSEYGKRLLDYHLPHTSFLKHAATEALSEGTEEVVNQFAEKTGYAQGENKKGKTAGLVDNINELGKFFDRTMNSEGALNFVLGAFGGVAQGALLSHVPFHKQIQTDTEGNPIPVLDKSGEIVQDSNGKPKLKVKLVNSHTLEANQRQKQFQNIKDAVLHDINWFNTKQQELQQAVLAKDDIRADQLRAEIGSVNQLNAVTSGLVDPLIAEYDKIAKIDNREIIDDQGNTQATEQGYAKNKDDNEYVSTAAKQVQNLKEFQKIYDEVKKRFRGNDEAEAAGLHEHIFHRRADLYLRGQVLNDYTNKLSKAEADYQQQVSNNSLAGASTLVDQFYNTRNEALDGLDYLKKERSEINNLKGANLAKKLAKYRISDFDPENESSMTAAANRLNEKLDNQITQQSQKAAQAEEAIATSNHFTEWLKKNDGKGVYDFIGSVDKARQTANEYSGAREYIRRAKLQHSKLALEQSIAQEELDRVESTKGQAGYIRAVVKDRQRLITQMEDQIKKENETIEKDQKNQEAAQKLKAHQSQMLLNTNIKLLAELNSQLNEGEKQLVKLDSTIAEEKSTAKGRIRSILNPTAAQKERTKLLDSIAVWKSKIVQLTKQNELLQSVDSDTTDIEPAEAEQTVTETAEIVTTVNPVDETPSEQVSAAIDYEQILESLPQDSADWLRSILNPVLEGKEAFAWNLLDNEIAMETLDSATAARLLQALDNIVNGTVGETAPIVSEVSQEDAFDEDATLEDSSPDIDDVAPEDSDEPEEDSPVDIPTAGEQSDLPVTPFTSFNDPAELEHSVLHIGTKSIQAVKINNMSLGYEETRDKHGNYVIKTNTTKINEKTSEKILKPNGLQIGQKVKLKIQTDYKSTVNDNTSAAQTQDDFSKYSDESGKVRSSETQAGNVPIQVVDTETDEVLGYLPRVDWVTAQYPDAEDYRNIVDEFEQNGEQIKDNVAQQVKLLMFARKKIVDRFNAGNGDTETTISERGSGKVILNFEEKDGKTQVVKKSAATLLPDTSLKFGVVSGGVIKIGLTDTFDGNLNNRELSQMRNAPVVLLPMADGSHSIGRIDNYSLNQRPFDINTAVHALETYLTQDTEMGAQYEQLTGFDILSDDGIRNFITQHYTYVQDFPHSSTAANAAVLEGQSRKVDFLFNITNRGENELGQVRIGFSYSGKPIMNASLRDGRLDPTFEDVLRKGLASRFKAVVFTDLSKNKLGINSTSPINEVVWNGTELKVRNKHANYNEYLKSFSETPVNGTNQLSDGTYVYGANPQSILDLNEIQRALVTESTQAQPEDTTIEDVQPEEKSELPINQLTDAEKELLDGFMDMSTRPANSQSNLSLETLNNLLTFTPVNKRNGKTVAQVISELSNLGITELAPGYNPFYKC